MDCARSVLDSRPKVMLPQLGHKGWECNTIRKAVYEVIASIMVVQ